MNKNLRTLWIIWFMIIQSIFILIFHLSGGIPQLNFSSPETINIFHFIPFIPLIIALITRVAILPKITINNYSAILIITVVGVALCEGAIVINLIMSKDYNLYNSVSILSGIIIALAYMPIYLHKSVNSSNSSRQGFYKQDS